MSKKYYVFYYLDIIRKIDHSLVDMSNMTFRPHTSPFDLAGVLFDRPNIDRGATHIHFHRYQGA